MKVVHLSITNFRTIKELRFLPADHNIILGEVNAGKSTILEALALALDPDTSRRENLIRETDFHARKKLDDKGVPNVIMIEVTLSGCTAEDKDYFHDYLEVWDTKEQKLIEEAENIKLLEDKRYDQAVRIGFRAAYDPKEDDIVPLWYFPKFSFLEGGTSARTCHKSDREKIGFFLIPADRDIRKALSFTRYSALDKTVRGRGITLEPQLAALSKEMDGKGSILFGNKEFAQILEEVQKGASALLRFPKGKDRALTFELTGLGHYEVMNILRGFIALEGEDHSYPIAQQGLGAKQVLVLAALRVLATQLKSAILAIEEPETGLHPHMQRAMTTDILGATVQTFLTTHSAHVSQCAKQDNVYCLIKNVDKTHTLASVAPSATVGLVPGTIKKVLQLRTQNLPDLTEAIFAPNVLLLEGETDREVLPVLCRLLAAKPDSKLRDLDGLGIAPIRCLGESSIADIAAYFTKQLRKRAFSFIDNEPRTQEYHDAITAACQSTFILPEKHEMETILVKAAKDTTIRAFIEQVTDSGVDYFTKNGTGRKALQEQRKDTRNYLLDKKRHNRLFADLFSTDEVPKQVADLLAHLNAIANGEPRDKRIDLVV